MTASGIVYRPLARRDFARLSEWLGAPHVEVWWREDPDPVAVEERYGPVVDGTDPSEVFVIEREEVPIGLIQRYRFDQNPDWQLVLSPSGTPKDAVGIDYFIGSEDLIGTGLGPEMIDGFVTETWTRHPDIAAVVVNIRAGNRRSWRALEKIGFVRAWSGTLASDDPSDSGINHVYVRLRP